MPTYSYVCESCEHKFDLLQTMLDDSLKTCPVCTKDTLKRLIGSGAGLIFKGTGFYITDYARKPDNNSGKSADEKSADKISGNGKSKTNKSDSQDKSSDKRKTD